MKKTILRTVLAVFVVLLFVVLLFTGKGHTLLLDNKAINIGGKDYEPAGAVTITVDSKKPVKLSPNERDLVVVKGIWHTIEVKAGTVTAERKFTLPFRDMFIVSIPALLDGNPVWCIEKVREPVKPEPAADEEVPVGGETIPL